MTSLTLKDIGATLPLTHSCSCVTCPACRGKGTHVATVNTFGKKQKRITMSCIVCDGNKMVSSKVANTWIVQQNMWCKCENTVSAFFDDFEHEDCIDGHHYHCTNCGLVTQVG